MGFLLKSVPFAFLLAPQVLMAQGFMDIDATSVNIDVAGFQGGTFVAEAGQSQAQYRCENCRVGHFVDVYFLPANPNIARAVEEGTFDFERRSQDCACLASALEGFSYGGIVQEWNEAHFDNYMVEVFTDGSRLFVQGMGPAGDIQSNVSMVVSAYVAAYESNTK